MAIDPLKTQKILCVCQKGNSRSVGTKMRLNRRCYGHAIAVGAETTAPETFAMLCTWADIILLAMPSFADFVPLAERAKIDQRFTIGRDKWGNPFHPELREIVKAQLNKCGLR